MNESVKLTPLGGLGRIGLNLMLLEAAGERLVIDCGMQFPDHRAPGVDAVLPDLSFLRGYNPTAYILTHGHEDHIGGVPYALRAAPAPIYGTAFTLGLVARKLSEHGLDGRVVAHQIGPKRPLALAGMTLDFLRVTHSIPDCVSVAFHTPAGTVIHTGDWKYDREPVDGDEFDEAGFRRLGDAGVLLLMSDSTNAEVPGWSWSERRVAEAIETHVSTHPGRVFVSLFSSNLHRVHLMADLAARTGRRLCLMGRSLHRYVEVAREVGRSSIVPDELVDPRRLDSVDDSRLLVCITGSQAESQSALCRAAMNDHPWLRFRPGDLLIHSARFIPGNERAIFEMLTHLSKSGAKVLHSMAAKVHASGHAYRDEMAHMLGLVRPRFFVPLHGEWPFLRRQSELAMSLGTEQSVVVENGQPFEVTDAGIRTLPPVNLEAHYRDGMITANRDELDLDERMRAALNGFAALRVQVIRGADRLQADVAIRLGGVYSDRGKMRRECGDSVQAGLESLPGYAPLADIEEAAEIYARRYFKNHLGKRPAIVVFLEDVTPGGSRR